MDTFAKMSSYSTSTFSVDECEPINFVESDSGKTVKLHESRRLMVPSTTWVNFTIVQNHPYSLSTHMRMLQGIGAWCGIHCRHLLGSMSRTTFVTCIKTIVCPIVPG